MRRFRSCCSHSKPTSRNPRSLRLRSKNPQKPHRRFKKPPKFVLLPNHSRPRLVRRSRHRNRFQRRDQPLPPSLLQRLAHLRPFSARPLCRGRLHLPNPPPYRDQPPNLDPLPSSPFQRLGQSQLPCRLRHVPQLPLAQLHRHRRVAHPSRTARNRMAAPPWMSGRNLRVPWKP